MKEFNLNYLQPYATKNLHLQYDFGVPFLERDLTRRTPFKNFYPNAPHDSFKRKILSALGML